MLKRKAKNRLKYPIIRNNFLSLQCLYDVIRPLRAARRYFRYLLSEIYGIASEKLKL